MKHFTKLFFVVVFIALILSFTTLDDYESIDINDTNIIDNKTQEIIEEDIEVKEEFKLVYIVAEYAHNMGISKHTNGCISDSDDIYIGYAYSSDNKWGRWKTYIQGIKIS